MNCVEYFFQSHQYTFSAIGAIATAFVAYLACRGYKPKIRAELEIENKYFFVAPNDQPNWRFVVVNITNLDSMPVQIRHKSFRVKDMQHQRGKNNFLYPIDYIDESNFPYHCIEDIAHQYYNERGGSEIHNPLGEDMKKYPVLINSGDSRKFYFLEERNYLKSFTNIGLIKKFFIKTDLFFLFYRPEIVLYNKFVFKIGFSKDLKFKIKQLIKNKP